MKNKMKNYTPHKINIYSIRRALIKTFEPCGTVLHMETEPQKRLKDFYTGTLRIIVVSPPKFTKICGNLLNSEEAILVSVPVAEYLAANPKLYDGPVYVPDTGPNCAIRNKEGMIIGTTRLLLYKSKMCTK